MSVAMQVQAFRDVEFILRDDFDEEPHLFVDSDSVCSSISGLSSLLGSRVETSPSPHLFLPYAAPAIPSDLLFDEPAAECGQEQKQKEGEHGAGKTETTPPMTRRQPSTDSGSLSLPIPSTSTSSSSSSSSSRQRGSVTSSSLDDDHNASTPHMFLSYASSGYQDLLSHIETNVPSQPTRLLDHDIVQFEAHCLDELCGEHELNAAESVVAAKAFGQAAGKTATTHATRYERLGFFKGAFERAMDEGVTPNTKTDSANEELAFLRSCVRELIGTLGDPSLLMKHQHEQQVQEQQQLLLQCNQRRAGQEQQQQQQLSLLEQLQQQDHSPLPSVHYPRLLPEDDPAAECDIGDPVGVANLSYLPSSMRTPAEVPDRIEIPLRNSNQGENQSVTSDMVSLLTPFDEPFVRCRLPSSDDVTPVIEPKRMAIQPFVPISGFSVSDLDSSKDVDLPAATRYIETVQLLMKCRPGRPSRKLLMQDSEPLPIQAHRLRLQLIIRGIAFTGSYNGSLMRGVPHGAGVFRFDNRDLYVGDFTNGVMHGEGTLFCRKKLCQENSKLAVLRGRFENNEFKGDATADDLTSAGAA